MVDGVSGEVVEELDFLDNSLSRFTIGYEPTYYMLSESDMLRPDLISSSNYGNVGYWWLILFINGVQDVFTEPTVGQLYTIPNMLDIYDFSKKFKVR